MDTDFNMKKNWITKDWLENEFSNIGTTINSVAVKANCNEKTINRF